MSHFDLFDFDFVRIAAVYGAMLSGMALGVVVVFAIAMLLGEPR